jgi:hypothetical protein
MYCPRWRQRVDLVAAHATAATAGNRSTEHHNGAGVDAPLATPTRPRRSADAAAAHNLSLAEHDKTPLMNMPFSWSEHGAPRRTGLRVVTEAQAAQFDELGFCVIEDAFSGDQLAALVAEIDALEAKLATDGGISTADEITFCAHLVLRSELCRGFTASPIFAGLCHDLLAAEDARLYWDQVSAHSRSFVLPAPGFLRERTTSTRLLCALRCWYASPVSVQEAGAREDLSVPPGQRVRLPLVHAAPSNRFTTRFAGTRSSSRSRTSPAGWRSTMRLQRTAAPT